MIDIRNMEKSQLLNRLREIRSRRRTGYTIPEKKTRGRAIVEDPRIAALGDEAAAKILEEILNEMSGGEKSG